MESVKEPERTPDKGDQMKPSQFRRLRIGDYRVIYEIDTQSKRAIVLHIGRRKNIYDDFTRLF